LSSNQGLPQTSIIVGLKFLDSSLLTHGLLTE